MEKYTHGQDYNVFKFIKFLRKDMQATVKYLTAGRNMCVKTQRKEDSLFPCFVNSNFHSVIMQNLLKIQVNVLKNI